LSLLLAILLIGIVLVNEVTLHWAWLILGSVTVCQRVHHLVTQINSLWPFLVGNWVWAVSTSEIWGETGSPWNALAPVLQHKLECGWGLRNGDLCCSLGHVAQGKTIFAYLLLYN